MGPSGTMGGRTWFRCLNFGYIIWGEFCSRKLTDILFYVRDIPQSTQTISEYNLIKWCQWDHLLDQILMGLRVWAAGLKVFMVSIDNLVCQLCIGCSLSLSNTSQKLHCHIGWHCLIRIVFFSRRHQRLIPGASPTGIKLKSILDLVLENLNIITSSH